MARGINLASALEGALKIKEISYMHAEGYAAGEMKHGPIAMIDPCFATIAMTPQSATYDKMLGNIREIKARAGEVIAIANHGDHVIDDYADHVLRIPETEELWSRLCWWRCRCSCWPITWPRTAARPSTSRETWQRQSPSNRSQQLSVVSRQS